MAAKSVPHRGNCGPCSLCCMGSNRYTHLSSMDESTKTLIMNIEGRRNVGCICHACYKQAKRNVGNENYTPRWRPKTVTPEYCGLACCMEKKYRQTSIASPTEIEAIVGGILSVKDGTIVQTPLCKAHYMRVTTALHAPRPCESCNSKPKWGEQHTRHCPSPDTVNTYLSIISGEPSTLSSSSLICTHCYKFFQKFHATSTTSSTSSEVKTILP